MKIVPYARVLPRARLYVATRPTVGCFTRATLLVLLGLLLASALAGQVPVTTVLDRDGVASFPIGNPTTGPVRFTIALHRDATLDTGSVALGDSVAALISPRVFVLQAGEMQVVRLKVRELVRPGELLRLTTAMLPEQPSDSVPALRLQVQLVIVSKVRAP